MRRPLQATGTLCSVGNGEEGLVCLVFSRQLKRQDCRMWREAEVAGDELMLQAG